MSKKGRGNYIGTMTFKSYFIDAPEEVVDAIFDEANAIVAGISPGSTIDSYKRAIHACDKALLETAKKHGVQTRVASKFKRTICAKDLDWSKKQKNTEK